MQQLERPLAGARVGALCQPQIAIDDADGGEIGEMVSLGDDLRADDDVGFAALDLQDDLAHFGEAGNEVG